MTTTTEPRDVPAPAGATFVDGWDWAGGGAMPYRFVNIADRTVTDHLVRGSTHTFKARLR